MAMSDTAHRVPDICVVEQAEQWLEHTGSYEWEEAGAALLDFAVRQLGGLVAAIDDAASLVQQNARVLDLGCGCGAVGLGLAAVGAEAAGFVGSAFSRGSESALVGTASIGQLALSRD